MAEPILKWAGGKRQILTQIKSCLPAKDRINNYHESFFGAGALFFAEGHQYGSQSINDINPRLMNFYEVVKEQPSELLRHCRSFEPPSSGPDKSREFSEVGRKGQEIESYYYQQREIFNRRPNGERFDLVEEAAILLYLNRTCFNGLYRENSSGEFNVPCGDYSNPDYVQERRIREASRVLQGVEIFNRDFQYIRDLADEGDLVYFDPPYKPVSRTSSFVEYHHSGFGQEEQERLRDVVVELGDRDVFVVVSNSPPMKDLYVGLDGFDVIPVGAKRSINSNGQDRGKVEEIIVTNSEKRRVKELGLRQFS